MKWWNKYKKDSIVICKKEIDDVSPKGDNEVIKVNEKRKIGITFKIMTFLHDGNKTNTIYSSSLRTHFYTTKESQNMIRKEKLNQIENVNRIP